MVVIAIVYFYQKQNVIYQLSVDLKIEKKESVMNFGSLAGGNIETFGNEILHLNHNYEFNSILAENLLEHVDFLKLNFTRPSSDSKVLLSDILSGCDQISCKVNKLSELLFEFYTVSLTSINNRYNLKVLSTDELTTRILMDVITNTLVKSRTDELRLTVNRQIAAAEELIIANQEEIKLKGGFKSLQDEGHLNSNIAEAQDRVRSLMYLINSEKALLTSLQLRLGQNKKTQSDGHDFDTSEEIKTEKSKYERYVKLKDKQKDLRSNLNQMSLNHMNRTESEKKLIAQMELELRQTEQELSKSHSKKREIAYDESFVSLQQSGESSLEFDYKVQLNKVKSLEEEFKTLRKSLDELISQKVNSETEMMALKPEFEYVRQLESKLMSLKLMRSSINSDVTFERLNPNILKFKRSPLFKITLFSLLLGFFFYFIILMISYIFDDRIYSEKEMTHLIKNLKVLGRAPQFHRET